MASFDDRAERSAPPATSLDRTPIDDVRALCLERAIHRLRTSDDSLDPIAEQIGYELASTLSTLIRSQTGRSASAYRPSRSR